MHTNATPVRFGQGRAPIQKELRLGFMPLNLAGRVRQFSTLAPPRTGLRVLTPTTTFGRPVPRSGTEVYFTKTARGSSLLGEQFWGRAVRASRNSKEFGALLISSHVPSS